MVGREAGHHVACQGHRRRLPAGRLPRHRRGGQGHDAGHPRLDLRRQSAGHGGRQGDCRHHLRSRLPRDRPQARPLSQAAAGRRGRRSSRCRRRDSRRGPAGRHTLHQAGGRSRHRASRQGAARGRRRRERRPVVAAAQCQRGRDRRGDCPPRCERWRRLRRPRQRRSRGCADGSPLPRYRRPRFGHAKSHSRREPGAEARAPHARGAEAARRQDPCDDLRQAIDAHPRLLRRRHARARWRAHHADRQGDAAEPRGDRRRYRARAVALRRRHHDPHPRPRTGQGSRRQCVDSRHQRTDPPVASLPGDGRRDDVRGEEGPDRRPHGRLDGRRQQCAGLVGPRGVALRFQAERRLAAGTGAEAGADGLGEGQRRGGEHRPAIRMRRRPMPIASSPIPGCPWATTSASAATICSSRIR